MPIRHLFLFLMLFFFAQEAFVSQVYIQDSGESLAQIASSSQHVVEVISTDKNVVIKEVVFPKETHFQKKEETRYIESAGVYKVVSVLKSPTVKAGNEIKVWHQPAYGEHLSRRYHEEGVSKSPIVAAYNSKFKIKDEKHTIVFLNDDSERPGVFVFKGEEDPSAVKQIKKLLKKK